MTDIPILPDAPEWFRRALAVPYTDHVVTVGGAAVHYTAWGQAGRRGLIFVHGGGAHGHWWTHIAARFAREFRVLAIDLTGHGDSDHRPQYDLEQWTDEVIAVAADGGIDGLPVVIGHSMGGFVTIATAARHGDRVAGVIICDSPVTTPDPEVQSFHSHDSFGRPRVYATLDDALGRFRTVPPQPNNLDFIVDHVARRSMRPAAASEGGPGWVWKFDRQIFQSFGGGMRGIARPYLVQVHCRFALLRSQYGLVTRDIGAEMYEALGRVAPVIELPDSGHHAMLDQPLVLLTAIRSLLADWDHSEPHRQKG
ncbi:MAG: Alpha/beta hydrolase [Ilumatobacteraceae bacterium]|nr:Alpha/beta hydrolase [Ilumatobacteraceae bacterium]